MAELAVSDPVAEALDDIAALGEHWKRIATKAGIHWRFDGRCCWRRAKR
jgi:hypothetical protein